MNRRILLIFFLTLLLFLAAPFAASAADTKQTEAKYIITIAAPRGWHTKTATVTIKLEDINGTGFESAGAKQGSSGNWQDMTKDLGSYGWAHMDISDNDTVYVFVTDKTGKSHLKSLYIECFDKEPPMIDAEIKGRSLLVDAEDEQSGVESIYLNDTKIESSSEPQQCESYGDSRVRL